jgi:ABC-2 type transport system permease protein
MMTIVRSEWTKIRTLTTMRWLLAATIFVTIAGSIAVIGATHISAGTAHSLDLAKLSLTGIDIGQAAIVVLAVLTISEEYGNGTIHATLAATPRRLQVLAAKVINLIVLTLLAGAIAVAGCLLAGRIMLPASGLGPSDGFPLISISDAATLRAGGGSVLYLALVALLALGMATAIRDTGVAIGAVLGLLYLPPILALAFSGVVQERIEQIAPMSAGLAIQATTSIPALPISPWNGLLVLATWAVASLATGGLFLKLRDA